MNPFLAMLLSLRIGFLPSPASTAALSIRDEVLQAATVVAARDALVAPAPAPARSRSTSVTSASASAWASPEQMRDIQREQWRQKLKDSLSGNATLANAVMWLATSPVKVKLSGEKVFVGLTVRTP